MCIYVALHGCKSQQKLLYHSVCPEFSRYSKLLVSIYCLCLFCVHSCFWNKESCHYDALFNTVKLVWLLPFSRNFRFSATGMVNKQTWLLKMTEYKWACGFVFFSLGVNFTRMTRLNMQIIGYTYALKPNINQMHNLSLFYPTLCFLFF